MIQAHQTKVQRTAHYFTIGEATKEVEYFWIVTHGYGQLASQIIHKFEGFNDGKHLILAPEALNKFYWKRPQVGATWMTSQHRLDEIEDYTIYLKDLYNSYRNQLSSDVKIILLGFSQGCQTQVRWILRTHIHFDHLILWAGIVPDDLDYISYQDYFSDKKIHWIYGNEDEFLKEEYVQWHLDFTKKNGLNLNVRTFEGKHRIDRQVLHQFWEENIR